MRRALIALVMAVLALTAIAPSAAVAVTVSFKRMVGYDAPNTPDGLGRVGVIKVGREKAGHVLILNPGTSASATILTRTRNGGAGN